MLKLDHFAFEVTDMDAAVDFYHAKLGLELLSRNLHEEVGEENAFLALDHGTLELIRVIGETKELPPSRPSKCPHLAFQTEDMDETLRIFKGNNIQIVKGPLEIEGTERWVYVADPDGNIVEFIHWIKSPN